MVDPEEACPRILSLTVHPKLLPGAPAPTTIEARQYVLDSEWSDVQPNSKAENDFLEKHPWEEYSAGHLGLTEGANEETKARYAFVTEISGASTESA
jgi:hypothetical protein